MTEHTVLETIERETAGNPDAAVIWLHGLGADGNDFVPVVDALRRTAGRAAVRFVFPHAPVQPVTLNGGMPMRAWYDLRSLEPGGLDDAEGLAAASGWVRTLMEREQERGIDPERIVLAGFSQGAATALHTAFDPARPAPVLRGVIALSGWLPEPVRLPQAGAGAAPLFLAHGTQDPVVQLDWGQNARDQLLEAGYTVQWQEYPMPHAVCPEEIDAIDQWLSERF